MTKQRPYYDPTKATRTTVPTIVVTTLIIDPVSKIIKVTETLLNIKKKS
jgi:hypothetical protein